MFQASSPIIMFPLAILLLFLLSNAESFVVSDHKKRFGGTQRRTLSSSSTVVVRSSAQSIICIALTREEGKNGKLESEIVQRLDSKKDVTVEIKEMPCIAHADGDDLDKLKPTLESTDFDYVAVTSPEAARVLATAWNSIKKKEEDLPQVAAVGKATQATLESLGIPVSFVPSKATAKTLVAELPPAKSDDTTTTLLYPASAKAATTLQDGLEERGFQVTRLNTYDTVMATWTEEEQEYGSTSVNVVCFGSPSAIDGWLANTQQKKDVLAACIGETSATACREKHGWDESNIFYPEKPGIAGWASSVEEAIEKACHQQQQEEVEAAALHE